MRLFFILFALMLFACGRHVDYSAYDAELAQNHWLLEAYFYHPERLKELSEYEGLKVDSMYSTLNDYLRGYRYTRYFTPDVAQQKIDDTENSRRYFSFGFERVLRGDTLIVSAVYPVSPANDAGLRKRDRLLLANGKPLTGEAAADYERSDDPFDDNTVFTVLREGKEIILNSMKKKEVQEPTVYLDSLDGVPFITVTRFTVNTNDTGGTYREFKNILNIIKGAKTGIIDLRGNPGGIISHCTAMAAELAPNGAELVYDIEHYYHRDRGIVVDTVHYFPESYKTSGTGLETKWILLVNGGSASCAERFAAAVKSSRPESVIIGQTTYGKGIGQYYMKTYLGGLAYITAIQTYYPNGETFHEVGIAPDVETGSSAEELRVAISDALQNFYPGVLAKRQPMQRSEFPPERSAGDIEIGAYKEIGGF